MPVDTRVVHNGRPIPVVAFFGTKGGVGKTTIARRFAELVTLADSSPNVLLIDVDVHNRGMTVEMTSQVPVSCKMIHDYIASRNVSDVEAIDLTLTVSHTRPGAGKLLFIPASAPEADHVFDQSARIGPERLLEVLHEVVGRAVATYDCGCVVIDCGPIIDPYTAAGAMLADREFIIGQNEPISFSNLRFYPNRIREFYSEFSTTKMKLIVNKVRGWERLEERKLHEDIFAAIPFTMDIIDVSEGLAASSDMQVLLFEDHIRKIVEKIFAADHPELIPPRDVLLPQRWQTLVENAGRLESAPPLKRLGLARLLLPIGLLLLVLGGFLFYAGSGARRNEQNRIRAEEMAAMFKPVIAEREASGGPMIAQLKQALAKVEPADSIQEETLNEAIELAKIAGVEAGQIPPLRNLESTQETVGIGVLLGGVVLVGLGGVAGYTRRNYLTALRGIRRGGIKWLMSEMSAKRSARKTFDKLLKMAGNLNR